MTRTTSYSLLRAFVITAFLLLVARLWYMQIVEVKAYRATATANKTIYRIVPAPRGIFYDRNGVPLVRNLPRIDVTVVPSQWDTRHGIAESRLLSRLLRHKPDPARIRRLVAAPGRNGLPVTTPIVIKQSLGYRAFLVIRSFTNHLPGVYAGSSLSHRYYLDASPFPLSHLLGYTGAIGAAEYSAFGGRNGNGPWAWQRYTQRDEVGQTGLEQVFEHQLHGVNGVESAQINFRDNQVTPWTTAAPVRAGNGVRLTISLKFENQVAQDLRQAMRKNNWPQGAAVVMNPDTGHILAMVSLPSYNANTFTANPSKRKDRQEARLLKPNQQNPPMFDNSYQGTFPPGSIYKIITATAGLASGVITPSSVVYDRGQLQRYAGSQIFHGWQPPPGLGPMDIYSAIAQSSDIFFYQVAGGGPDIPGNGLGPRRLDRWAKRYGLGQPTGIELGDATGLVPTPRWLEATNNRPWSYGDSYNMGIGQGGNLVTVLQMARAVSVIANGGNLVRPTLVAGITGPNGRHILRGRNYGAVPDIVRPQFVPRWITRIIAQGMRQGVTRTANGAYGTSYGQVDPRARAAGKTGTAEDPHGVDAWWIGFAPYRHPKIAVAVVFPRSNSEGAWAAAPVASKIMLDFERKPAPGWLDKVIARLDFFN